MGNTVKPSTALLPMEDIANVLKEQYKFSSKEDIALDTSKVANTDSKLIAIAATDELGKLASDRETIKNALNLNGIPASDYMTRQDGSKIENFGDNVSKIFADEISDLRDEFYQLIGTLTRYGVITESGSYSGFQDFFRNGDKKYYYDSLGDVKSNSIDVNKIYPQNWEAIKPGDLFVIHKKEQNVNYVVRAAQVEDGEVTIENVLGVSITATGIEPGNIEILRVLGEYNKGSFSFSEVVANAPTNKEKYTMLNDDSNPKMEAIQANNAGYGVSFNIPSAIGGALKKLSIVARSSGSPGLLNCYVMEDTDVNRSLVKNLDDEEIGTTKRILAKAKAIPPSRAAMPSPVEVDFEFQSPIDGSYPILESNKRYLFFVVAEQANLSGDKWEIQFSKNAYDNLDVDVHANNKSYTYTAGTGLTEVNTIGDMIFILATIEVKANDEKPHTEGLYTSEAIKIHNANGIARARLTMRVNREGLFVSEMSKTCKDGESFDIAFAPNSTNNIFPSDLGIKGEDTIVIGTNIRKVATDCRSMQITLKKGVDIQTGDPVYKIGYQAFMRVFKKVWNPETFDFDISNEQLVPLDLICVMPDRFKSGDYYSDRLIFECEFRDPETQLPLDINNAELQILWDTNNSYSSLIDNHTLIGRIYDLTLSLDRTL